MTSKPIDDPIKRRRQVFYEKYADGTFQFDDGKTLKVCVPILAEKSKIFEELFFKSSKKVVDIHDYDYATFKLFIDCLMEFQKCTTIDALLIFPIAWKFEEKRLIKSCYQVFKFSDLNENVCLALNTALICGCDELRDEIIHFISKNKFLYRILDDEKYYLPLEPEALKCLLVLQNGFEMDSYVFNNVLNWGNNYLKKRNMEINLKPFFEEIGLGEILDPSCFETARSLYRVYKSGIGRSFFSSEDFENHVVVFGYDFRNSYWCKIKKSEILIEKFLIKDVPFSKDFPTIITVHRNRGIFYNYPDNVDEKLISYKYWFKIKRFSDKDKHHIDYDTVRQTKLNSTYSNFHMPYSNGVSDVEVAVEVLFLFDGRIMKKTPKNFFPISSSKSEENKYFIDYVEITHNKELLFISQCLY